MAELLEITTLGGLTVRHNGKLVTGFVSRKVEALLVYLACSARSQSREVLAERLWDERSQGQSLTNLRTVLSNLRQRLAPFILADRKTIGLDPCHTYRVDVADLETGLNTIGKEWEQGSLSAERVSQLEQVLGLYRGDFLEGFTVYDGKGFEDWMLLERDRIRSQAIDGLHHLVNSYLEQASYSAGISQASRLLQLDPLREEAHRQMMRLLARTGQRNAALAQYETCQKMLSEEFGVEPAEETTLLCEQIQNGKLPPASPAGKPIIVENPARPHNLPQQPTPFIGRAAELAQIAQIIEDLTCRLLTLAGPGGIGKTRLALQAASAQVANAANFEHGVYFVQLAPLNTPEAIVPAIAEALRFLFFPGGEPRQQLLDYLRARKILLVLDNVEHLLAGVSLIAEILQAAPGVKMLVTSRERLNIEGESVLRVEGMSFPEWQADWKLADIEKAENAAEYSAVKLFMQSARRVQSDFALTNDNLQYISRICRLVEGMPLGILLAAAWVEVLSPREIVAEIENNLSFLETDRRDVPARHRSLRAAIDYSWNLLTVGERDIFQKLSVFRGGFTREAAQQVAGASLKTLMTLVNKSLLRRDSNTGRYEIHELLRQYAEEHLAASEIENAEAHARHSTYYADFMFQRWESLKTRRQRAALDEIENEIDNIRTAWQSMIRQCRTVEIHKALNSLWYFMALRSHYQEAVDLFGGAAQALRSNGDQAAPETQVVVGHLLAVQGRFANSLGYAAEGKALIQEALSILQDIRTKNSDGADDAILIALESLALVNVHLGEWPEAQKAAQQALSLAREHGDQWSEAWSLYWLGSATFAQKDTAEARRLGEESLKLAEGCADVWLKAVVCGFLLGGVASAVGDFAEAKRHSLQGLGFFEELGQPWGVAASYVRLGNVTFWLNENAEAWQYYRRGIRMFAETGQVWQILTTLIDVVKLLLAENEKERAVELLALVREHHNSVQGTRDEAERLLAELADELPEAVYLEARKRGESLDLDSTVRELLED